MKNRLTAIPAFFAVTMAASTAWACPPMDGWSGVVFGSVLACVLALPYAVMTSMITLSQATEWFGERVFVGWLLTSIGGGVVSVLGAGAGLALGALTSELSMPGAFSATLVFSTPAVFVVAYMMWRHSKRPHGSASGI